jgi:2-polyprenyl-3-methyl-5-hydroxy-6-metoxy-1,4-benzoquinol methylase
VLHEPEKHNSALYYLHELRGQIDLIPRHVVIAAEMQTAMKDLEVELAWASPQHNRALDICAGIGIYAPLLLRRGYHYEAVEMDIWASRYIEGAYGGPVHRCRFEDFEGSPYDVIVMAHGLEHCDDAPMMLEKCFQLLKEGGLFCLLIPDNTDLANPDHQWFFTEAAVQRWVEEVGFSEVKTITKRVVPWENFIYLFASRGGPDDLSAQKLEED